MKIWLDDLRVAPEGYETVKSVNEAIELIEKCEKNNELIEVLDLDHDLGDYAYDGGDAIKLLDYLAERETFYLRLSLNPKKNRQRRLLLLQRPG